MGEYSFLEEAVILQITRLLQVVQQHTNGIPNFITNGANNELDKLVEFAYKNNFSIPIELALQLAIRRAI